MSLKLQLTYKGSSGTKTLTVPNPVAKADFKAVDAKAFASEGINKLYGSDTSLSSADYITTTTERVFPEA